LVPVVAQFLKGDLVGQWDVFHMFERLLFLGL
jgi:hypothetical protein